MLYAVLSGFVLSLVAPWLQRMGGRVTGWIIAILPLGLVIYFATLIGPIANGQVISDSYAWIPTLEINLAFYADGLSVLFALIITGVGTLIHIYAVGYMHGDSRFPRFFVYLNLFLMFISLSSFSTKNSDLTSLFDMSLGMFFLSITASLDIAQR